VSSAALSELRQRVAYYADDRCSDRSSAERLRLARNLSHCSGTLNASQPLSYRYVGRTLVSRPAASTAPCPAVAEDQLAGAAIELDVRGRTGEVEAIHFSPGTRFRQGHAGGPSRSWLSFPARERLIAPGGGAPGQPGLESRREPRLLLRAAKRRTFGSC
jgi:hypothetical protein